MNNIKCVQVSAQSRINIIPLNYYMNNSSRSILEDQRHLCFSQCLFKQALVSKPFIYEARESSLVPEGFLTSQLLQKLYISEALTVCLFGCVLKENTVNI